MVSAEGIFFYALSVDKRNELIDLGGRKIEHENNFRASGGNNVRGAVNQSQTIPKV
jgi:hypothetical protein